MKDEIKEIYLSNTEWTKIHDNMGGVIGNCIFKNNMSYEEYIKLCKNIYFVLCNKDYITTLQKENENLKTIIKEIDDYCAKTNGIDRKKGDLDLNYNYICGWNAGKDEVCTQISFILDKENKYERR